MMIKKKERKIGQSVFNAGLILIIVPSVLAGLVEIGSGVSFIKDIVPSVSGMVRNTMLILGTALTLVGVQLIKKERAGSWSKH